MAQKLELLSFLYVVQNDDKTEELLLNGEWIELYLVPPGSGNPTTRRLSRKIVKTCLHTNLLLKLAADVTFQREALHGVFQWCES